MPAGLDFAAAATIPVAFMTAVYALGHLARLEAGERVLIHGGAGGVGLAAIQYALQRGAVVYATAGSAMRRQTLRMLGVAGVFDSRSASFVDELLAATGGEGVDVVLELAQRRADEAKRPPAAPVRPVPGDRQARPVSQHAGRHPPAAP